MSQRLGRVSTSCSCWVMYDQAERNNVQSTNRTYDRTCIIERHIAQRVQQNTYIKQFPGPFPNMYRMSHAPDIFRPSHTSPAHKKIKLMVIAYITTHLQLGRLCWSTLACQSMVATSWSGRRASRMWGTTPDPCAADVWSHSSRACTCAHGSGRSTHSKSEVLRSVLDWIWTTHGMLT